MLNIIPFLVLLFPLKINLGESSLDKADSSLRCNCERVARAGSLGSLLQKSPAVGRTLGRMRGSSNIIRGKQFAVCNKGRYGEIR